MSKIRRALATEWYRSEEMGNGIKLIEEQHIKPSYRCNIFYVRGRDRDLLVDTGMGLVSLTAQFPILADRPTIALASHTHFDHIGSHFEFKERLVHRAEAQILAHPTRADTLVDAYVNVDMFTLLPPDPFDPDAYAVAPAPATRILDDGDLIDLGNRRFEVIHAPGHSPGSIGLLETATGIFMSGDIVYDGNLVDDTYHSNPNDYIASLDRILGLPIRIVHPGHYDSFGYGRLREIIETWLEGKRPT